VGNKIIQIFTLISGQQPMTVPIHLEKEGQWKNLKFLNPKWGKN
jgi:hypothetical protein